MEYVDLPRKPKVPSEVAPWLRDAATVTPTQRPLTIDEPDLPQGELSDEEWHRQLTEAENAWLAGTSAADAWIDAEWVPWSAEYLRLAAVKKLHLDLFDARDRLRLERDSIELVWGFGVLDWESPLGRIRYPLISVPAEIETVPGGESLRVRPAGAVEVENRCLAELDLHDQVGYQSVRNSFDQEGLDVWDDQQRVDALTRLRRAIHGEDPDDSAANIPHLRDEWVLYLRRKVANSGEFLEQMRQLYRGDAPIPEPLRALLTTADGPAPEAPATETPSIELMLPLAYNEEQERILQLVHSRPGITVQGPPGTGKSHTIANLISHYVAQGQRVLVVAEKEQALRVLRDKIPADIREMTVSVLGADDEGRKQLERSVQVIKSNVLSLDARLADRGITELTQQLVTINRDIASTTAAMRRGSHAESITLPGAWPAGADPTPATAAAWLAAHPELDVIPDHLAPESALPLSISEYVDLVDRLTSIGLTRCRDALEDLPDPTRLPDRAAVIRLRTTIDSLAEQVKRASSRATAGSITAAPDDLRQLADELDRYAQGAEQLLNSWARHIVRAADPMVEAAWRRTASTLTSLRTQCWELVQELSGHRVEVPTVPDATFETHLKDAQSRFERDGKLGVFARDAKRAAEQCVIDGHPPQNAGDIAKCLLQLKLDQRRRSIVSVWSEQAQRIQAPPVDGFPEQGIFPLLKTLEQALQSHSSWSALADRLRTAGRAEVADGEPPAANLHAAWCRDAAATADLARQRTQAAAIRSALVSGAAGANASPLWGVLLREFDSDALSGWDDTCRAAAELRALTADAERTLQLLARLSAVAPQWAHAINTNPPACPPADTVPLLWQWRQLDVWSRAVTALPSPQSLQTQIEELQKRRSKTISDLVAGRAWRRLKDRIGSAEQEALEGYTYAVRKYGKTGGKFAARWIRQMRDSLEVASRAVPVWIMPTSKAVTSFRPAATPPFDVLIIDEASQISFGALPLLALATRSIIVGDDRQTSPENVGLDRQWIYDLQDRFLGSIPNYANLFDPDKSLYDLATQKFTASVMLKEHFRCLPDIIAFSNKLAYAGEIVPLRDRPPHPDWTQLGLVRVLDRYREGDLNRPEAEQVVALIERLVADPAYDGMSFGVISLLGTTQSAFIRDQLYEVLGPEIVEQRQIRCGEAANFQGDERDVMVLSTVVDNLQRRTKMGSAQDMRRFNVAASRARNQMWVVTSVDAGDLAEDDLRAHLIRHVQDPGTTGSASGDLLDRCDSDFERRVVQMLIARGHRHVDVQHRVGRHRIDIVVEGASARLAIECDGDRWHGDDRWDADRSRQQVLERAGWTFERIRGSAFYRDADSAMEPVWRRLAELGISSGDDWAENPRRSQRIEVGKRPTAELSTDEQDLADELWPPVESASVELSGALLELNFEKIRPEPAVPTPSEPAAAPSPGWAGPVPDPDPTSSWEAPPRKAARASEPAVAVETEIANVTSEATTSEADTADVEFAPASTALSAPDRFALAPYTEWEPRSLVPVATAVIDALVLGLVDIVKAEGPVRAGRVFGLYVRASGGRRVGSEIRRTLEQAVRRAIRSGSLRQLKDTGGTGTDATLYIPGQEPVQIRELGGRDLYDVPLSELRTVWDTYDAAGLWGEQLERQVLSVYGQKSLTAKAQDLMRKVRQYRWEV